MRASEMRGLTDEELAVQLNEYKEELFNLRFQLVTGQLDNIARLTQVRREIARLMTVRRERALHAEIAEAS